MSLLTNHLFRLSQVSRIQHVLFKNSVRSAGYWNKDWKPGPYPVTPEQRAAAAKKYNLRPDEYEPYPDDGTGLGDYPKLPLISADSKDPYYDYDYPEHRRNFGEPVHADNDMMTLDRLDLSKRHRVPLNQQALTFFSVMAFLAAIYLYFENKQIYVHWPRMPKQMPAEGVTHYTFEPAD